MVLLRIRLKQVQSTNNPPNHRGLPCHHFACHSSPRLGSAGWWGSCFIYHLFLEPGLKEQLPSSKTCCSWSREQGQETWKRHPVALKLLVWHQKPLDKASSPVRSRCGVPALDQETLTSHLSWGSGITHPVMVTLWGFKKVVQKKKVF